MRLAQARSSGLLRPAHERPAPRPHLRRGARGRGWRRRAPDDASRGANQEEVQWGHSVGGAEGEGSSNSPATPAWTSAPSPLGRGSCAAQEPALLGANCAGKRLESYGQG